MSHIMITPLRQSVYVAKNATSIDTLGELYKELVGHDPHTEEPSIDIEDLRGMVLDYIREVCYSCGIHVSRVGI